MARSPKRLRAEPRLFLTPGEPAGIGPDLTILVAARRLPAEIVAVADPDLLRRRARRLGARLEVDPFDPLRPAAHHRPGRLWVQPIALRAKTQPGRLDPANSAYVMETLRQAVAACRQDPRGALVTGPVQKSVINDAGLRFTGHTEYLAETTGAPTPVMMLTAGSLRVALATTHLPLSSVPRAITRQHLSDVIRVLDHDLRVRFRIRRPRILVAGLNPHAGERGHLGREEIDVIEPALDALRAEGLRLAGPLPADTLFTREVLSTGDAVLAMYHDQGLPVLKHAGFGRAVNVTLGLPLIRTSVDHGTALDLAGTGRADPASLLRAIEIAAQLARAA